jgi:3-oxoadipate enol-lactonase
MGVITTRRGKVGITRKGEGGTPLLFLHGVGSDRSAWTGQVERFGSERRTLAIDWPGYGDSEPMAGATRGDFAELALAVLDEVGAAKAHVCGLSLGGVIAITMHERAPERIASLILADTFARHPEGPAIFQRSLAGVEALGMRGLAEARVDALLAQPADPALRLAVIETMAAIDPAAYFLAAEAVWLADQRREAAAIACPALIMCGSADRITPPSLSEELKELVSGAGLVEIAGAGHLPNLEQPAVFNRVVAAFLSEVEGKS